MSKQNKGSEPIKVTDKRIFTADGEIRDEFKEQVTPVDPQQAVPPQQPEPKRDEVKAHDAKAEPKASADANAHERRKRVRDQAENPGTPFTIFIESLILNAYMSLGMIRNPYQDVPVDLQAAKQLIDMIAMLSEKTKGNLTQDEDDFLQNHLGQLKLGYVQRSKAI